jgi:hypothetical protein
MMEALLAKYKTLLESLRGDLKRFKGSEASNYKVVCPSSSSSSSSRSSYNYVD